MNGDKHRQLEYARDLLWVFFTRDLKVQYKRSLLGVVWSLIYPIVQLLVFAFLFKLVFGVTTPRYSAYAFSGILVWTFFANSITQGTQVITNNRELVRQPGFPVSLLPVSVLNTTLYQTLVAFPVLIACMSLEGIDMGLHYVQITPLIAVQFIFSLGLIYFLASLNVVFRDIQHIVTLILHLAMFVSPVFWERSALPADYLWVYACNPMASLLDAYRAVLLHHQAPPWSLLLSMTLGSTMLVFLGHRWFRHMSHRFAEEL